MQRRWHRPRSRHTASTAGLLALSLGVFIVVPGCVKEGPPQRSAPASSIPEQPADVAVNRVVFTVAQVLEDRDRNGYYDTIPATVYLFDTKYPYSIRSRGTFSFALTEPDSGRVIASWDVPWEAASKLQTVTWTGTIFPFQLDLREARRGEQGDSASGTGGPGGDRLPASEVLIGCRFTPEHDGAAATPIECGSRLTVLIGKTR